MERRLILVSGACGSGKSVLARLAVSDPHPGLGSTAAIEVDEVYMMGDPTFSRPWPEAAGHWEAARGRCAMLARSFLDEGVITVMVVGNSLHVRGDLASFFDIDAIVHHVTLDPTLDTLRERMADRGDQDKTPEWLQAHIDYMRLYYDEGWSLRIDNSSLTPIETLDAIADAVAAGSARLG